MTGQSHRSSSAAREQPLESAALPDQPGTQKGRNKSYSEKHWCCLYHSLEAPCRHTNTNDTVHPPPKAVCFPSQLVRERPSQCPAPEDKRVSSQPAPGVTLTAEEEDTSLRRRHVCVWESSTYLCHVPGGVGLASNLLVSDHQTF